MHFIGAECTITLFLNGAYEQNNKNQFCCQLVRYCTIKIHKHLLRW